jgi:hypothetical protein
MIELRSGVVLRPCRCGRTRFVGPIESAEAVIAGRVGTGTVAAYSEVDANAGHVPF